VQFGLVISVILHAAILGWAFITIHSQRELRMPEPDPIITGLVTESELTKLKLGARTAKQAEAAAKETPKADPAKKEAAKPKPVAAAPALPSPPDPPQPDPIAEKLASAQPPPAPVPPPPSADEQKKLEDQAREAKEKKAAEEQLALEGLRKAEEQKRADEQKRAEEQKRADEQKRLEEQQRAEQQKRIEEEKRLAEQKRKAEEDRKRRLAEMKKKRDAEKKRQEAEAKQKEFDAEKIAALLNKVPNASTPPPSAPPTEHTKNKGPALGAPEGKDTQISASEANMLRARISARLKGCWRLPSGGGGTDTPVVTLRWRLKQDGSLDGDPQVEQPRGDSLFRIAAEAAMRAVRECSPFDLPADKYSTWRTITWEFDPSQMM
jgi:colicin import membrane protein